MLALQLLKLDRPILEINQEFNTDIQEIVKKEKKKVKATKKIKNETPTPKMPPLKVPALPAPVRQ